MSPREEQAAHDLTMHFLAHEPGRRRAGPSGKLTPIEPALVLRPLQVARLHEYVDGLEAIRAANLAAIDGGEE